MQSNFEILSCLVNKTDRNVKKVLGSALKRQPWTYAQCNQGPRVTKSQAELIADLTLSAVILLSCLFSLI